MPTRLEMSGNSAIDSARRVFQAEGFEGFRGAPKIKKEFFFEETKLRSCLEATTSEKTNLKRS